MNKKTVLISGASRGSGRAAALAFAREQDNLIITCQKNKELLDQVKQEAEAAGSVCLAFAGDMGDFSFCQEVFAEAHRHGLYPDLVINQTNYSVLYQGKPVDMPPKELELLYFLASSPNQVFTREQLLDHIWGYEYIGDTRTVDVHIKRLREKIGDHPSWSLTTVWGIGYKFDVKG